MKNQYSPNLHHNHTQSRNTSKANTANIDRITFGRIQQNLMSIKPLQNPFSHSNASTTIQKSNKKFQLNDRAKMRLTESRVSDSDSNEDQCKRQNQNEQQQKSKLITIKSANLVNNQQTPDKLYEATEDSQISKIVKQSPDQSSHSISVMQQFQEPADQDIPDTVGSMKLSKKCNFLRTSKFSLSEASQNARMYDCNSQISIIDKIRGESQIIQSIAIEKSPLCYEPEQLRNTQMHKKKRIKIFDRKLTQNSKQIQHSSKKAKNNQSKQYNRKKDNNNLSIDISRISFKKQQNSRTSENCPHTQCILKSLEIIDKLTTEENQKSNKITTLRFKNFKEISSTIFQLSLKIETFITTTKVLDLKNTGISNQIKKIDNETERLLIRLKGQQYFSDCQQISQESQINCMNTVQTIHKKVSYLKLMQERYLEWESKLSALMPKLSDIFSCNYNEKTQKIRKMRNYVEELRNQRIFLVKEQNYKSDLFRSYNFYLEQQAKQIEETLIWVKEEIFRRQLVSKV